MYRIAICDDAKYDLRQTYHMVLKYSDDNGLDFVFKDRNVMEG